MGLPRHHQNPTAGKRNYRLPDEFPTNFMQSYAEYTGEKRHLCKLSNGTNEVWLKYASPTLFFTGTWKPKPTVPPSDITDEDDVPALPGNNRYLENALLARLYERTIPALFQAAAARAQQDLNAIYMATAPRSPRDSSEGIAPRSPASLPGRLPEVADHRATQLQDYRMPAARRALHRAKSRS
jgi:hypothetical protein